MRITNPKNPRIQRTARLRNSRERKKTGRFLIDGLRELERALVTGIRFEEIYVADPADLPIATQSWLTAFRREELRCQWIDVDAQVMSKLCYGDRNDGIIGVARIERKSLDQLADLAVSLVLIVEQLENPGNLGAILRTADAVGVDAILLADAEVDLFNPNVIRASMGAAFTVPTVHVTAEAAKQWCLARGITLYAARVDGEQAYDRADFRSPTAIALGNEAQGLSDLWRHPSVATVRLPMRGVVDSLNVSVTAGVLLYEVQRQRAAAV